MSQAQQVNLYALRFRRETPPLGAVRLAQIGVAVLLLLVLLSVHAQWRGRSAEQQLEAARSGRAQESTRLVEMASLYPARPVEAALENRVERLARERDAKTRLLDLLSNHSLGNTDGFSDQMGGLARRRIEGLWLRELSIRQGGAELLLSGSTLAPELVPRLLQDLGEEEAFAGTDFRSLRMERPEDAPERIDFQLRTHPEVTP